MQKKEHIKIFLGVMVMGSIWGMLEASLGSVLHIIHFPYKGEVMANIGFFLMGWALVRYKKIWIPAGMALIAASFKILNVAIVGVPLTNRMIVNPAMAIILEGLILVGVVGIAHKVYEKNILYRSAAGFAGMFLSYLTFSFVFFYVFRQGPMEIVSMGELAFFTLRNGGLASMLALFSFPSGMWAGRMSTFECSSAKNEQKLYYTTSLLVISCCWLISAVFIVLV
ncbi:hypothetical protein IBX65_03225 [Candidatus Aerophobetes bacterium]|nr:hypothetical protein [Candidatus Aerophobetes bacterium]